MKTLYSILIILCYTLTIMAEGTKQLRPTEADFGYMQVNDVGRPFALVSNTDSLHRLYIHIANISETIYFGFQPFNTTLGNGTFRISDPNGVVVYAQIDVPVSSGAGYIETYAEACAGPKIGGLPTNGYTPLSYTPTTTGDYYIEFTTKLTTKYMFRLFDITVVDASNTPIDGRLWSYAWDLNTNGGTNEMNATFYVYTNDKYVSAVDMNRIQPFGFVIACNSTGTAKSSNGAVDRQSRAGNHTYPEYKIFLNVPDTNVYDIAEPPTMIEDLAIIGSPMTEEPVYFYLNMNKAGTLDIILDIDDVAGFQPGIDRVLVAQIKAGGDTVMWDAKDGQGNFVEDDVMVSVSSQFATGVTHLPLYDPEYHPIGYIVNRILPETTRAELYWDDSQFTDGTVELLGTVELNKGHNFPHVTGGYGNNRTMNTWWNGFEIDNLKSFTFTMNGTYLPITLSKWEAVHKGSYVQLFWTTQSETNNHYFEIERSTDGLQWLVIGYTFGAGNSNKAIHYTEFDNNPVSGTMYYRLKQVDLNGTFHYTPIISIGYCENNSYIKVITHTTQRLVTVESPHIKIYDIQIKNLQGVSLHHCIPMKQTDDNTIQINTSNLASGAYIIFAKTYSGIFYLQ